MASKRFMLFWETAGWKLADLGCLGAGVATLAVSPDPAPAEIAACVAENLGTPSRGNRVVIGISSQRCLAATISLARQRFKRGDSSLAYRLEEVLPLAAEDFVADFIASDSHPQTALGVATEAARIAPVVDALEAHGIHIDCVTPTVMLALQHIASRLKSAVPQVVLWKTETQFESFCLPQAKPSEWNAVPSDEPAIQRYLGGYLGAILLRGPENSVQVVALNVDDELDAIRSVHPQLDIVQHDVPSVEEAAAAEATAVLAGRTIPWIDFRSADERYRPLRGSLRFVGCSAAALCLAVAASFTVRTWQNQQLAGRFQNEQAAIFQEAFPGQPVPGAVLRRLRSEHDRLAGLAGRPTEMPLRPSALSTLYRVLQALPDTKAYRLLRMQLDGEGNVILDGDAVSHRNAGEIASGLSVAGFEVDPPRSENQPGANNVVQVTASWPDPREK